MMSHNLFDDHKLWGNQTRAWILNVLLFNYTIYIFLQTSTFSLTLLFNYTIHIFLQTSTFSLTDSHGSVIFTFQFSQITGWRNKNVCHPFLENIVKPGTGSTFSASFSQSSTHWKRSQGQENFALKWYKGKIRRQQWEWEYWSNIIQSRCLL